MFGGNSALKTDQGENQPIFGGGTSLFGLNVAPSFGKSSIFGISSETTPKTNDETTPAKEVESSVKSVFGQSLFGPKTDTEVISKPIFGQSVFGAKSDTSKTEVEEKSEVIVSPKPVIVKSLFGNTSAETISNNEVGQSLFGNTSDKDTTPKSVFGQTLFGGQTNGKPEFNQLGLFGKTTPVFGQNIFGTKSEDPALSAPQDLSSKSFSSPLTPQDLSNSSTESPATTPNLNSKPLFGQSTNIFGTKVESNSSQPVFGQASSIFGAPKDLTSNNTTSNSSVFGSSATNTNEITFKSTGLDFAQLASESTSIPKIETLNKDNKVEFVGLTNNNSFSSFQKARNKENSSINDSKEYYENDENHDPQFEPLIALPPEIVLSTGEENETKLFGDRAKLFRFDEETKEWKERGEFSFYVL